MVVAQVGTRLKLDKFCTHAKIKLARAKGKLVNENYSFTTA